MYNIPETRNQSLQQPDTGTSGRLECDVSMCVVNWSEKKKKNVEIQSLYGCNAILSSVSLHYTASVKTNKLFSIFEI